MFEQVAPGVYAVSNRWVEGKSGIVVGHRDAAAVDACGHGDEGQAMAAFIVEQGFQPRRLLLTHGHGDHILGGAPFKGADVFAHESTASVIRGQLEGWAEETGETTAEVEARVIWPTITFRERMTIDLGGKHLQLIHAPGHSIDGACVYVEEDRVLFGGDTAVTGIVPAIGGGDSVTLESTLRMLAEMTVEVLVPGHGSVMRGEGRVRQWLLGWADYLAKVRSVTWEALQRGEDPESVASSVSFEEFVGSRLPADRHDMRRRHHSAVAKIIQEGVAKGDW